jgi:hypothetical protein
MTWRDRRRDARGARWRASPVTSEHQEAPLLDGVRSGAWSRAAGRAGWRCFVPPVGWTVSGRPRTASRARLAHRRRSTRRDAFIRPAQNARIGPTAQSSVGFGWHCSTITGSPGTPASPCSECGATRLRSGGVPVWGVHASARLRSRRSAGSRQRGTVESGLFYPRSCIGAGFVRPAQRDRSNAVPPAEYASNPRRLQSSFTDRTASEQRRADEPGEDAPRRCAAGGDGSGRSEVAPIAGDGDPDPHQLTDRLDFGTEERST